MKSIWHITKKEFVSYFTSPIAYVAIAVFLVVVGLKFFVVDEFFDEGRASVRSLFTLLPIFFMFYLPAITMKLITEEKTSGTFELLMTLPLTDAQIILGKFFGALGFLLVTLLFTLAYPLLVGALGAPDVGTIVASYVGIILLGAAYIAVGIMTSSWSGNQIVSYVLAAVICAFLYFQDALVGIFWGGAKRFMEFSSFSAHYSNFLRGVLDSRDLLFFVSAIALALLVGVWSLNKRRWN